MINDANDGLTTIFSIMLNEIMRSDFLWRVFTVKINGIEIEYQQLKSTNTLPERMD